MPLERTNALVEDSMVTAHLGEEICSAEMLIFTRLHRTAAMCLDDDSVLSVYNNLQVSRCRKESTSSSDYVDISGGTPANIILPRAVSWSPESDTSSSNDGSHTLPLSARLKRNVSRRLKEARRKFKQLGRSKMDLPPENEPQLQKIRDV